MANAQVVTSKLGSLNKRDFFRGLLTALITAVVSFVYQFFQNGGTFRTIDWESVLQLVISTVIGYLFLQLGTGNQILVNNPTTETVAAVKEGAPVQVAGETIAAKHTA